MDDRTNPFLEPSPLPYELPLFGLVRTEHYREAIVAGMREQRAEVEAIATDAAPPSFDNTLVALERSGALLRRVLPVLANASSADTNDELDALEAELAPKLAAHRDVLTADAETGLKGRFVKQVATSGATALTKPLADSTVTVGNTQGLSASLQDVRFHDGLLYVYWVPANNIDPLDLF